MSADNKDARGWGRRFDRLIDRVGDEVGGERGEKVRARLTEAKSRVEAGLESDEARRIRDEMVTLGDKALEHVDDALRHERTQAVVKRVDAAISEIGDRLRSEHTEPSTSAPSPKAPPAAAGSEESVARTDATAETDGAAAIPDTSSVAGDAPPAVSTNGEDETPTKRA